MERRDRRAKAMHRHAHRSIRRRGAQLVRVVNWTAERFRGQEREKERERAERDVGSEGGHEDEDEGREQRAGWGKERRKRGLGRCDRCAPTRGIQRWERSRVLAKTLREETGKIGREGKGFEVKADWGWGSAALGWQKIM